MQTQKLKFTKGDIFWNTKKNQHPIIFLEWINEPETFKACIISKENIAGNIKMEDDHFFIKDNLGKDYAIINKPSYLISDYTFKKEIEWLESPIRVGKLTSKGIRYVEDNMTTVNLIYSDQHISIIAKS
ncbi:hypothetical protein [Chryseobacterium sp. WLY505]|uniref:hypothetical protein n=1 Tax=Chryseobacterium sp. WLY505 TaxID=3068892 RepID=UPI00279684D7|nr:hypothetical protein [Chryseobacterium sp. WLY505]MDQ1855792.1 hypothetical protein [Chryseobacterium sp. WLY505]